jgi:flavin-dependent thymidylate synthase
MKCFFTNVNDRQGRDGFSEARDTKRPCSLGLEFLLNMGTPIGVMSDGSPDFPQNEDLRVGLVDYAGNESDVLPESNHKQWFDKQLNHMLPRCSDLDRLVVLFHCQNFPIASTVPCMLNGSAGVNEFSGRYAELPESTLSKNTLARMFSESEKEISNDFIQISEFYGERYQDYFALIKDGVSRELSRGVLPTSQTTEFYTKVTVFNLIKFIQFYDSEDEPLMKPVISQMKIVLQLGYPKLYSLFKDGKFTSEETKLNDFLKAQEKASVGKHATFRLNSEKLEASWGHDYVVQKEDGTPLDGDQYWVKVTDYSGTEKTPYDAVGMSMGNLTSPQSIEKLVNLLISLGHCSPFELTTLFFDAHIPFFVFRHIIRHRTMGIYNWRFTNALFIPEARAESEQKMGADAPGILTAATKTAYDKYLAFTKSTKGHNFESEFNSLVSPATQYVKFAGRIDIHNLVHILNLRKHPAAQYETRMLAHTLQRVFEDWAPVIYDGFISNNKLEALAA